MVRECEKRGLRNRGKSFFRHSVPQAVCTEGGAQSPRVQESARMQQAEALKVKRDPLDLFVRHSKLRLALSCAALVRAPGKRRMPCVSVALGAVPCDKRGSKC